MMDVTLENDLKSWVEQKVQSGEFPTEQAVVEAALRQFRSSDRDGGTATMPAQQRSRAPGPFLPDDALGAPCDLPRPGRARSVGVRSGSSRLPDLFPGE